MDQKYDITDPNPDALIESLRSFGYTPSTAIADLIDNSITADALNIDIRTHWDGARSWISILDDGGGMNERTLVSAMRVGSQHPGIKRADNDLGRWGLGLKTASWSACRSLTVITKVATGTAVSRRWDLDHVNATKQWQLLHDPTPVAQREATSLESMAHGTLIVWEALYHPLVASDDTDDSAGLNHFLRVADDIGDHIAMVFHRFMRGRGKITFRLNDNPIVPWDPFLEDEEATHLVAHEQLPSSPEVEVKAYVLPHVSKISREVHSIAGGRRGWNAHQGFYVYRNRRMIIDGSWLDLTYKQEEHFKLARILIDLPNSLDSEWGLDAKKSFITIPSKAMPDLLRLAKLTRSAAEGVFRHRTRQRSRKVSNEFTTVWKTTSQRGQSRPQYRLDRTHPILASVIDTSEGNVAENAYVVIEETLPVQQIWIDASEHPDGEDAPFTGVSEKHILDVMRGVHSAFMTRNGDDFETAISRVAAMDAFREHAHLLERKAE